MSQRAAFLLTLLFAAGSTNASADNSDGGGELCPRSAVVGEISLAEQMGVVEAQYSGIGCALAPVIDPERPAWLAYDLTNVPRRLITRVALDLSQASIAVKEEVDVLDVRAQTMYSSPLTVSIGGESARYVRLSWLEGGTTVSRTHPLSQTDLTLGLLLDRGEPENASGGFLKLLVDGATVFEIGSGATAAAALPLPGSTTPVRLRLGVLGVRELDPKPTASAGVLFIRPVSVELVWPKRPSGPEVE
jgi:hypothetical protein